MWGGGTETTTQTNEPSNPDVNPTLSKLLKGVQGTYDSANATGAPDAMTSGWGSQLSAANDPTYSAGVSGAMSDYADIAAGNRYGMDDPGYATMRQGALDDAMTGVGSSFLTDGRFGSSVMGDAAGKAATQTLAGLDYANFQNDQQRQDTATQMLPTLFAAGQAPGSVQTSVGQQQQQAPWATLNNASGVLGVASGAGGTTATTTSPTTPWWQSMGGIALGMA